MGSKQSNTQQQQVEQKTNVTVTNVIEDRALEPLERVKLIAEIFETIDRVDIEKKKAQTPSTVVVAPPSQPFNFLQEPKTVLLLAAAVAGVILITRGLKKK